MKKQFFLAGMILAFTVMTVSLMAQSTAVADKETQSQAAATGQTVKGNFTDNNKDGICDHQQNKGKTGNCSQFTDKNGDGKCDNCTGQGNCNKGNCCAKGVKKGNCCPTGTGNGCGGQHRHGNGSCQSGQKVQPEKK